MKKTILALSIACLSLAAFPSFAQNESKAPRNLSGESIPNPYKSQRHRADKGVASDRRISMVATPSADEVKRECNGHQRDCHKKKGQFKRGEKANLFAGIQLTDAQKEKLEKAKSDRKSKIAKLQEKQKKEKEKIRESYLKEMKKILTPAQYEQFRKNLEMRKAQTVEAKKRDEKGYIIPGEVVPAPLPMMDYKE